MKGVVAELKFHEEVDHEAGKHAKREPQDVDRRGQLMAAEAPKGEYKLLFYHVQQLVLHAAKIRPSL